MSKYDSPEHKALFLKTFKEKRSKHKLHLDSKPNFDDLRAEALEEARQILAKKQIT
jgi:hypothetical protein